MRPLSDRTQTLKAIGVLTRSTTHDLNNCMAAIIGFAELVIEGLPEEHPMRDEMNEILAATHSAVAKTRELDQLARRLARMGAP